MTTIEELRRLLDAATPRPWIDFGCIWGSEHCVASDADKPDADLIMAAVNALPKLLDVVDAALPLRFVQAEAYAANPCFTADELAIEYNKRADLLRTALARLTEPGT